MAMFERGRSTDLAATDRWEDGVGWFAHPGERGRRASHAVRDADGGVWVVDPLDAPGVDDLLAELGTVVGVVVLSKFHARDADAIARRHGVPTHVPSGLARVADRLDGPAERLEHGFAGFDTRDVAPIPGWTETVAYRASDRTLYVPDLLGTAPGFVVGEERLGVYVFLRPFRLHESFAGIDPARVLVGHGAGVLADAERALDDALVGARRRFPRALREHGLTQLRAATAALVG